MFDPIYLLLAFVVAEIAVLSVGLFVVLPRRLAAMIPEAELMLDRQKKQLAAEFSAMMAATIRSALDEVLNADTVKAMAADAAGVLGDKLGQKFGGMVSGVSRRARSDPVGSLIELAIGQAMQKFSQGGLSPLGGAATAPQPASLPGIPYAPA